MTTRPNLRAYTEQITSSFNKLFQAVGRPNEFDPTILPAESETFASSLNTQHTHTLMTTGNVRTDLKKLESNITSNIEEIVTPVVNNRISDIIPNAINLEPVLDTGKYYLDASLTSNLQTYITATGDLPTVAGLTGRLVLRLDDEDFNDSTFRVFVVETPAFQYGDEKTVFSPILQVVIGNQTYDTNVVLLNTNTTFYETGFSSQKIVVIRDSDSEYKVRSTVYYFAGVDNS